MSLPIRVWFLSAALVLIALSLGGCASVNMHCDGAGKGWECTQVDGPPERHTRSPDQPPWSDEHYDIGRDRPQVSEHVIAFTNEERTALGHNRLREDTTLSRIACWHNKDMLGYNYMGHEDSDERMPIDRVAREHRRFIGMPGENTLSVYRRPGSDAAPEALRDWAREIVDQWMESPGHKANILNRKWTHIGACVTSDSTEARGTQVFGNVRAYFDEPIPWAVQPGDSLSVSVTPVGDANQPVRYQWVPGGESLQKSFEGERPERPFNGVLAIPTSTGTYGLRVMVPRGDRTFEIVMGPRVRVLGEGEVAY